MIRYDEAKQLVADALSELVNNECPHCGVGELVSGHISDEDIENFVREHKLVVTVYTEKI